MLVVRRSRGSLPLLFASAVGMCLHVALLAPAAVGQFIDDEPTTELRQRLFDELRLEAAEFEQRNILKKVVRLVKPTVVHIKADKRERGSFGQQRTVEEAGSGVIVEFGGQFFVLTNLHVIKDAALRNIAINLSDGRRLTPTRSWQHDASDIAVMAVAADGLISARLGDSELVEIGDFVVAVGSPFGLSHSVTYGIISAKGRRELRELQMGTESDIYQNFLQTDAAINPGNSGGPLINLRGEVIGINTAIVSNSGGNEGIGFTIPINMVMVVARQLVEQDGRVARAYMGVTLDSRFRPSDAIRLGLPRLVGAHVKDITPGSPAEAAKLQAGDVILRFNGVRVEDDSHLTNIVSLSQIGKEVPIVVFRDRQPLTIMVTVGDFLDYEARVRGN